MLLPQASIGAMVAVVQDHLQQLGPRVFAPYMHVAPKRKAPSKSARANDDEAGPSVIVIPDDGPAPKKRKASKKAAKAPEGKLVGSYRLVLHWGVGSDAINLGKINVGALLCPVI
jgi:hypothetical protein